MRAVHISVFFLYLLLGSTMAAAIPYNTTVVSPTPSDATPSSTSIPDAPSSIPSDSPASTDIVLAFQALPNGGSVCQLSSLTPDEVQRFRDNILVPGLKGKEISPGTPANKDREKITDQNKIIIPDANDDATVALQQEIPTQALSVDELSPILNKQARGAFSYGLVLDDTIRAAKRIPDQPNAGWGEGVRLKYRNSSEGITGVATDIKNVILADANSANTTFTDDEKASILAEAQTQQLLGEDSNASYESTSFGRVAQVKLLNHINVDNTFSAKMLTNCADGKCVLTLYSMFDKYFNDFYSGDMVISTFGPTLFGQFKKMLAVGKRRSLISANLADSLLSDSTGGLASRVGNGEFPVPSNTFATAAEKSGNQVLLNDKRYLQRDVDSGTVFSDLFGGDNPAAFSGGKGAGFEDKLFAPDGAFGKIKDLETRERLTAYMGKTKNYADNMKTILSSVETEATNVEAQLGRDAAQIYKAKNFVNICADLDDSFNLDCPGFLQKSIKEMGFANIFVKTDIGEIVSLKDADSKFFGGITKKMDMRNGFRDVTVVEKVAGNPQAIQLYRFEEKNIKAYVFNDIVNNAYPQGTFMSLGGVVVPANATALPELQSFLATGGSPVVYRAEYIPLAGPDGEFTAAKLANKILTGGIFKGKLDTFPRNVNGIYETMLARDWAKKSYTNLLSKNLQSQENLFKNYFTLATKDWLNNGVGLQGKMYLYWYFQRGFGNDKFSVYQLPKEFTWLKFVPGNADFYKDAYIDVFANEGADDGDLFKKAINSTPVAWILDKAATLSPLVQNAWNWLSKDGRDHPDNVGMFMFGDNSCPDCRINLSSSDQTTFTTAYLSPNSYNAFFIEDAQRKESIAKGQFLQVFAHRTDIKGQARGEKLDEINLLKAHNAKPDSVDTAAKTCTQAVKNIPIYGWAARVIPAKSVGGVIAATENMSYHLFGLAGTFVTAFNQVVAAPQLQGCVDDEEGYYASFSVPKAEDPITATKSSATTNAKSDDLKTAATSNILQGIRDFATSVKDQHKAPSFTDKALTEAAGQVQKFVDQQQKNNIAEAQLSLQGSSQGYMHSQKPLFFWFAGGSLLETSQYSKKGKTIVSDNNGNTITLDNTSGTLSVNGVQVVDPAQADHVRLAAENLAIPAIEVPQRLGSYAFNGDSSALLMNINVRGEATVLDPALLNCIQQAVLDQSAVPLNGNNISEAFGKTNTVVTDAYPGITIDTARNRIVMGGVASQTASGANAAVQIYGDRHVSVVGTPNPEAGNLNSVLLDYGSLVYKPETNTLLIWLRTNAQAVVSDKDVKNFSGKLTNTTNPTTSCQEPAVDLKVATDPNAALQKLKGDNLTASLQKDGPFQVFDTDTKSIILYSKLVDGVCKPFLRVIDKATGQVYDQEIKDISQNPDGTIQITTADGKVNTLKFSDQNGKPVVTFNGQSELLRSASGKNGSFYYDPNKGLYFAENAQFVPLSDDFKNKGLAFQANPDGTVSGKASDNIFNINTGQQSQDGLFNIPSLPENAWALGLMLVLMVLGVLGIFLDARRKKESR